MIVPEINMGTVLAEWCLSGKRKLVVVFIGNLSHLSVSSLLVCSSIGV